MTKQAKPIKNTRNSVYAAAYQTTPRQIRRWVSDGAPMENIAKFYDWLHGQGGRVSIVRDRLDDPRSWPLIQAVLDGQLASPMPTPDYELEQALDKLTDTGVLCRLIVAKTQNPDLIEAVSKVQESIMHLSSLVFP